MVEKWVVANEQAQRHQEDFAGKIKIYGRIAYQKGWYRLIITKSYPKVSYLWVTFSFFTAQQQDSIRTTLDVHLHNS